MQLLDYLNEQKFLSVFYTLLIPLIAAGIGYLTNFLAIKMLFYPRIKKKFLGVTLHGVFPKRQKELGSKLGELFADRLGVQKQLDNQVNSLLNFEDLRGEIHTKIEKTALEFVHHELPFLAPMLPPDLISSLSKKVGDKLFVELKERVGSSIDGLQKRVDVKSIVENEIVSLEVEALENLLQELLKREFRFIEFSGAIVGFLIGCLQLLLAQLI